MEINELKAKVYDLTMERGRHIIEVQRIEAEINVLTEQITEQDSPHQTLSTQPSPQ